MILTLEEAQAVRPGVTAFELEALEVMVRTYTNNKFQNVSRRLSVRFTGEDTIEVASKDFTGFKAGDTVEITGSEYNDGLYTIKEISPSKQTAILDAATLVFTTPRLATGKITRIEYPADVKAGILNLLRYQEVAAERIGIKSESVGRMSRTYDTPGGADSLEGYPAALLGFLQKYRRMRWE